MRLRDQPVHPQGGCALQRGRRCTGAGERLERSAAPVAVATAVSLRRMNAATIASLATAGGTLVLAIATFSATRSANRSTRIAEQALQVGLRPVLFNARFDDPAQKVGWIDDYKVVLQHGQAAVRDEPSGMYLAIPLRNVGSGLAVLHGWHVRPSRGRADDHSDLDSFERLQRDLYVPAGDVGFWQAALRDPHNRLRVELQEAIAQQRPISVEILYGDHEGGQRTITLFNLAPREGESDELQWTPSVARHWNIDRPPPR